MKRFLIIVALLVLSPDFSFAGQPDECAENLAATGEYVLILKDQRDRYEQDIARLKYHLSKWQKENAQLQAEKKEIENRLKEVQQWRD